MKPEKRRLDKLVREAVRLETVLRSAYERDVTSPEADPARALNAWNNATRRRQRRESKRTIARVSRFVPPRAAQQFEQYIDPTQPVIGRVDEWPQAPHYAVLGVDPGLTGAIAAIASDKRFLAVWAVPTTRKQGAHVVKRRIDGDALARIGRAIADLGCRCCFFEDPGVIPMNGAHRIASLHASYGAMQAAIEGAGIPVVRVTVKQWKSPFGIYTAPKRQSCITAGQLYPQLVGLKDKQSGLAEATIIARYGLTYRRDDMRE